MPSSYGERLILSVLKKKFDDAKELLVEGADPNVILNGQTALHAAVATSRFSLPLEMIDLLLGFGAPVDGLDDNHSTPLMKALLIGKIFGSKTAAHLITNGADVGYVRDEDLATPISHAMTRASPDVIKILINRGAPVDGPPGRKITPLMRAVVEDNLKAGEILVECGADLSLTCALPWAMGKTAAEIAVDKKRSSFIELFAVGR